MVHQKKKSNKSRQVAMGVAHIHTSFNNTIVAISDLQGQVLTWKSAGMLGFKGSKKSTPYAAQVVTTKAVQQAIERHGLNQIIIKVKGPGPGRDTAVRTLGGCGLKITEIQDVTPVPHNGVRPRKQPRG